MHLVFPEPILQRGRELYQRQAVRSVVKMNEEYYTGEVMGSRLYVVHLQLNLLTRKFFSQCDCKYSHDCKHGAALVFSLLLDQVGMSPQEKEDEKITELHKIFESNTVDQYREIPLISPLTFGKTIELLSHKIFLNVNKYDVIFTGDGTLLIEAYYQSWNAAIKPDVKNSTSVKIEDGKIYFKCNNCKIKTNRLCSHQQAGLSNHHVQTRILDVLEGRIRYDDLVMATSESLGLTKEVISENFRIQLDPNGVNAYPVADDILLNSRFRPRLGNYLAREDPRNDIADFIQHLENNLNMANAFAWSGDNALLLLKGRMAKNGTSLASHIELAGNPLYWTDHLQLICVKLFYAFESENVKVRHSAVLHHRFRMQSLINYFIPLSPHHFEKIKKKDLVLFRFSDMLARLQIRVSEEKGFTIMEFSWIIGDQVIDISEIDWQNQFLIGWKGQGYLVEQYQSIDFLNALENKSKVRIPSKNQELIKSILDKAKTAGSVEFEKLKTKRLSGGQKQIHLREIGNFIVFEPSLLYPEHRFPIYDPASAVIPEKHLKIEAEPDKISEFREEIRSMHPLWDKEYVPQGFVYLAGSEVTNTAWFMSFIDKTAQSDIEIFGQENLSSLKFNLHRPTINMGIKSGIDWFDAKVSISFGGQLVPQRDWIEYIKSNQKYIRLRDGTLGMLPDEWIKKLKKLVSISETHKDELQISKLRFNVVSDLFAQIDDQKIHDEIAEKQKAFENFDQNKKYRLPAKLKATLRPYQVLGYQWLKFLDEFNFGGCLADDMGLGKTLQVITFLMDQKKSSKGTSLVVIPKSLLFNWSAEIEKFGSGLHYLIHHGQSRDIKLKKWKEYDVILSTYDTVARDAIHLQKIAFNYIILDESQAIKNPHSVRYKSMRLLKARNRLAMTGTPIENNTFDLYAQISFLNPGLLGSIKHFKEHFSTPIDNFGDEAASATLRRMVHPFLLRRTKEQVAKDLPERTETILYCEMETEQRKLYDALRVQIKEEIENKVNEGGLNKAKFMMLEGLLRLRQICNATELVDDKLPPKKRQSIKIEVLLEQIKEELGNHKALIFSQFVSMLSLIKKALDKEQIRYAYLDGSTQDRKKAVSEFLDDDDCHLFLISLKAGNTGLNLVKADYVYIVDPWWNPAVEAQAIDRTHRIGQTRNIFAYRLICKDTIEEKIVQLQQKKKKLASDLIQTDENVFKALSKDELMSLFE